MLLVFFDACNYGVVASNASTTMIILYSQDPIVQSFNPNSPTVQSLISISLFIGCFVGSFITGILMQYFGRKTIVIAACILAFIFNALMIVPLTWWYWFIIRILIGIPTAAMTTVDPAWLSEVATVEQRGFLTGCYEVSAVFGQVISALMLLIIGNSSSWQVSFIPPLVCNIAELVITLFLTVDSKPLKQRQKEQSVQPIPWKQFFVKKFSRMLSVALTFGPAIETSGKNAIVGYATKNFENIFQNVGQTYSSIYGMLLIQGSNFIFTCIGVPFVNRLGRRWLLFQGFITCAVCLVLFVICYSIDNANPIAWLLITTSLIFLLGYETGPGPVFYVAQGEAYAESVKPQCSGIGYCAKFAFNILVVYCYPYFQNFLWAAYLLYFVLMSFFVSILWMALPETKGKTLQEIEYEMYKEWGCQKKSVENVALIDEHAMHEQEYTDEDKNK